MLDATRREILARLATPASASQLARSMELPRQKVNYHLRSLEHAGLVACVEERRKGNCTERIVQATASHYLVVPQVLGDLAPDEESFRDRWSWSYLVASASRVLRDLTVLRRRADEAGKQLQTCTLESEVRFANAQSLGAFTEELSQEVARLITKYQADDAAEARTFRFVVGAYPKITKTPAQAQAEQRNRS